MKMTNYYEPIRVIYAEHSSPPWTHPCSNAELSVLYHVLHVLSLG